MKHKPFWIMFAILLLAALACDSSNLPAPPDIDTPPPGPPAATPTELQAGAEPPPNAPPTERPDLPTPTPRGDQDAEAIIEAYARDVLGFEVDIRFATSMAQNLNIPLSTEQEVDAALALSGVTYFGIWPEGLAAVAFGEGSFSGDYLVDIQNASLGAFSTRLAQPLPADAAAALALLQSTYPALANFNLVQDEQAAEGFVFYNANAENYQLESVQATLTGTVVRAGVAPGGRAGSSVVWVVVASGALATPFE